MTIEDFLRLLLRNALLLVIAVVLGAAAGFGFSFTKTPVYQASALGYVSASGEQDEDGNAVQQASGNMDLQYSKAQSYLPLFGTRAVGETVKQQLALDQSADAIAGSLQASIDPNAPIITVTATASSSQAASDIANAAVEAAAIEARKLETGGNENTKPMVQLAPYQTAVVPGAPVAPDRMRYLAVGAASGLLLGLAVAYLRGRNDSRLRTMQDVARTTAVPTLGVIPQGKDFIRTKAGLLPEPKSFQARESVRKLRTNLRFADIDSPVRSIVLTSSAPGEGKSTVAGNLARVMARAGQPTLLIDADMRRPVVAKAFGVDGSVGLSQLLVGAVSLEDVLQPIAGSNLVILPSGQVPPNPSELVGSNTMRRLVEELSKEFFIIIDAPPVLAVTDAQLLASVSDGAVLVALTGKTRAIGLQRSIEQIEAVSGRVLGVVLNRASNSRLNRIAYGDAEYGYSSYGYGYGAYGADSQVPDDVIDASLQPAVPQKLSEEAAPRRAEVAHAAAEAASPEHSVPAAAGGAATATPRRRARRAAPIDESEIR